jgi:hypothetical protein
MDARMKAQVIAVAGPLVALLGARVLLSPGAASAGAVHEAPLQVSIGGAAAKATPEQERVIAWCAEQEGGEFASPFVRELFPRSAPAGPVEHEVWEAEPEAPAPEASPAAGLRLSAVMGTADGGVAIIGGKMYKPGQQVRAGLVLTSVDARGSRVELTDSQGRVWRLSCEK